MKKGSITVLAAAVTAALLCACAPQEDTPSVETAVPTAQTTSPTIQPETTSPTTQPVQSALGQWEDTPADRAFQKALTYIHNELYWPGGQPSAERIQIWEPGTIEDEQFAVIDVDGDGEKELLVSITNTYMAGMCEVIYGYDAASDSVRIEAEAFPGVTYYPGMMQVLSSHNQGYAGDVLWPYSILTYDEGEDAYKLACFVDAWSREISETDYEGNPYPEDIDTDHDGYVYLITENDQRRILNRADFEKWETELFAGKEPLTIPWQKLTAENIA